MSQEIKQQLVEQEMKDSYVDYAMSVIVGRALPDVRDGLKPVHRRILYTMQQLGLQFNKPYKKSARIVGDTLGKYHPHGDTAVYEALVRMAQPWNLRYLLIDGQGNFGSQDGDSAAAMRYSEARLSKLAEELLQDLDKDTVDFVPNFDNSLEEPLILPSKIPNLLINGSSGIAVGMATSIPPHNLNEIIDSLLHYLDNPNIAVREIMQFLKGPDFPTGGAIIGLSGIEKAYESGKGKITVRGKTSVEQGKRTKIIISEIPYQLNKSMLIESIADLVRDKRIEGIYDIRDESDRRGMRIVLELLQNAKPDVLINQLYKFTQLQTTFGIIFLGLLNNQPKIFNLKELFEHFLNHRKNVIIRRTRFDLNKAEEKYHILIGINKAIDNLDNVIDLIRKAENPKLAQKNLMEKYTLSEKQSQAILEMRLQKLTSLEQTNVKDDLQETSKNISDLKEILASEEQIKYIIKNELTQLKNSYGDKRKTLIETGFSDDLFEDEDLIQEEQTVITLTNLGYIKQTKLDEYKQQQRGGKGIIAVESREGDHVKQILTTLNTNHILFFTNLGRVYWLKAYRIPQSIRYSKGQNIVNLLALSNDEKITAMIPVLNFDEGSFLLMTTKKGLIKKTKLAEYNNPRKTGIKAINLKENDELIKVILSKGNQECMLATQNGIAVRLSEKDVKDTSRNTSGVRGIRLVNDNLVDSDLVLDNSSLFTITENGYGKRTNFEEYSLIRRGGKGVRNIKTTERNGKVVAVKTVKENDDILVITKNGKVIRVNISNINLISRNTSGVRIIRLEQGDKISSITVV